MLPFVAHEKGTDKDGTEEKAQKYPPGTTAHSFMKGRKNVAFFNQSTINKHNFKEIQQKKGVEPNNITQVLQLLAVLLQ